MRVFLVRVRPLPQSHVVVAVVRHRVVEVVVVILLPAMHSVAVAVEHKHLEQQVPARAVAVADIRKN